jgi:hypothetical protein
MTTALTKPVKRRTIGRHRGARFVAMLEPGDLIGFRIERKRRVFYTTLAACFDLAVRQQVAADKAAKRAARKARA